MFENSQLNLMSSCLPIHKIHFSGKVQNKGTEKIKASGGMQGIIEVFFSFQTHMRVSGGSLSTKGTTVSV